MPPEKKALLSPALRATLQKIAAAYGVSVDALIDAALGKSKIDGATLAAKALAPETIAMLRAIPWPQLPAPSEEPPRLASPPPPTPPTPPTPPDVVITVDGVHLTCPCVTTVDALLAAIAQQIPHLVARAQALDLHFVDAEIWGRMDPDPSNRITLRDGDVLRTHAKPKPPLAPPAEPPPAA